MQNVKADAFVISTVVPWKNKTACQKLWAIFPWLVFGVACVWSVVYLILIYDFVVNNDSASELVLAKLLSEGKGFIITDQWFYSTELRFLNTQLIFAPLFWLYNNWQVVRIVGTVLWYGVMLGTFYLLLASLRQKRLFPWLATLLLLPLSIQYMHIVILMSYYIPHITISFTVLALTFYALRADASKRRFWWLVGGGGVLSLLAAIGGFRQVVILSIPLMLTAVVYWLMNRKNEHKGTALKFLTAAGIGLGAALVGLGVNILINQYWIGFKDFQNSTSWTTLSSNNLWATFSCLLEALGYQTGKVFGGAVTWGNLLAFGILVLLIISFITLLRHRERYQASEIILGVFCLLGIVVMVIIDTLFVFDGYGNPTDEARYFIPVVVFVVPWLAVYLQKELPEWQVTWRKFRVQMRPVLQGAIWVCVLVACLINCGWYSDQSKDHNQSLRAIATTLMAGGYYQGYASLEQSNILTEFSNGAIEVWCWGNPSLEGDDHSDDWADRYTTYNDLDQVQPWLQRVDHFYRKPTGKVFLLFTLEENEKLVIPQKLAAAGGHVFYVDQYYIVYTYDSSDELRAIVDESTTATELGLAV